jgi:uncharacterized protein YecT (DUF1311 family)
MRKYLIALGTGAAFIVQAAGVAIADDTFRNTNCNDTRNQMELNYCADRDFQVQDRILNALYRSLMAKYDARSRELLTAAEKNWLTFRDSECTFETQSSAGGSIRTMEYSVCLNRQTKARIRQLQAQRDCEEGDLTCNRPG